MKLPITLLLTFCWACTGESDNEGRGTPDFDINDMMSKQNCPNYRCTGGYEVAPKSRPKFESAGCSTMAGGISFGQGADGSSSLNAEKPYSPCCDQWNACYSICGASKKLCDANFEKCAEDSCGGDEECTRGYKMNTLLLGLGGCNNFNLAQSQACECTSKEAANTQREAAIRHFYKNQAPESSDKATALAAKTDSISKYAGLFLKLLKKYPAAIKKVDPPKQDDMADKINAAMGKSQKESEKKKDPSDENIEL